ncbi:hypothetical protein IVB36_10135 [Bradyrhizobium sp. 35]|nr:hypothetical protein [Bradyrhizobium sp. 35]MCK1451242.1 hypothetical protein [Bradyrhizobium sp. 35]
MIRRFARELLCTFALISPAAMVALIKRSIELLRKREADTLASEFE